MIQLVPEPPTHLPDLPLIAERAGQRLGLNLRRLGRCEGRRSMRRRRQRTARQRPIGVPLQVVVERLQGWKVNIRRRVLWWQRRKVWVVVSALLRELPIPNGSPHNG